AAHHHPSPPARQSPLRPTQPGQPRNHALQPAAAAPVQSKFVASPPPPLRKNERDFQIAPAHSSQSVAARLHAPTLSVAKYVPAIPLPSSAPPILLVPHKPAAAIPPQPSGRLV